MDWNGERIEEDTKYINCNDVISVFNGNSTVVSHSAAFFNDISLITYNTARPIRYCCKAVLWKLAA